MKKQDFFWLILVLNHDKIHCHRIAKSDYPSKMNDLLKPYPYAMLYLLVHSNDYATFLVNHHQLNASDIQKSIRYLAAETNDFENYDDWLLYFSSMHADSLQVMSVSPTKVQENIHPLTLETFCSIDCFDHALANAIIFAGYGQVPTVIISHEAGLVRCILIEDYEIRLVQETTLFEQTKQSHSEQLMQRLLHYFQPYHEKPLLLLMLDPQSSLSNMPEKWECHFFDMNRFASLLTNQQTNHEWLPLIGAGLFHAASVA